MNAVSPSLTNADWFAGAAATGRLDAPVVDPAAGEDQAREAFHAFFGEFFYGQMLKSMRSTVGKAAYFDGGRAEEVFQGQLDQVLTEELTRSDPGDISRSMYEAFSQIRRS